MRARLKGTLKSDYFPIQNPTAPAGQGEQFDAVAAINASLWRIPEMAPLLDRLVDVTRQHPLLLKREAQTQRMVAQTIDCEPALLRHFLIFYREHCARGAVFVDSGANDGLWSLLAAAHGCHSASSMTPCAPGVHVRM